MSKVELYTKKQLEEMTLAKITEHNALVCSKAGLKATKRFSTKPAAVSRTLQNQILYKKTLKQPEQKVTTSKPRLTDHSLTLVAGDYKDGTMMGVISDGIAAGFKKVSTLTEYIMENYTRPRSGLPLSRKAALHEIRWFIKQGNIEAK